MTSRGSDGRSCTIHASFVRTFVVFAIVGGLATLLTYAWTVWTTERPDSSAVPRLLTFAVIALIMSVLSSRSRIEADQQEIRMRRLGGWKRWRWEELRLVTWTFQGFPRRGAARLALDLVDEPREEFPVTLLTSPHESERAADCLGSIVRLHGIDFEATTAPGRLRRPRATP